MSSPTQAAIGASAGAFEAGWADRDITPPLGTRYLAHSPRHGRFTQVLDPLMARALAIRSGPDTVVIVSVDLIGLGRGVIGPDPLALPVRREISRVTEVPVDHILVAATHAHSTPETSGITDLHGSADAWLELAVSSMVDAGVEAVARATPCKLRVGRALVDGQSQIRRARPTPPGRPPGERVPASFPDRSVTVLSCTGPLGRHLLVNYACHPVMLQAQPGVSADYPGALIALIEASGDRAAFLQGACGDVNPSGGDQASPREVRDDAALIAAATARATTTAVELQLDGVSARSVSVRVPTRRQPTELRWAGEHLSDADPATARRANDIATLAARLGALGPATTAEVQVLRIGSLLIVGLPGEPFSVVGGAIKAASPTGACIVAGYTGDYLGYLAPRWEWLDGGYEVADGPWSLLSGAATEYLVEAAIRSCHSLWQEAAGSIAPEPPEQTQIGDPE